MQRQFIRVPIVCFLCLLSILSSAQVKDALITPADSSGISYLKFAVSYLSNNVYNGRKDSARTPYITPVLGYYHKSGFYAEASVSYLISDQQSRIDLFTIDGGYDFHSKNEKLSGELYAAKYFFNSSSYSVRSEIKGEIDGNLSYNFGPLSFNGGADLLFSTTPDIILNAGISHAFEFEGNDEWAVTPDFLMNIGSLNYYKDYYKNKRFRRSNGITGPLTLSASNNFSVLNYEFSLPLTYDGNKWEFFFTPTYSIPVNPLHYSINGIPILKEEQLSNSFYFEIGGAVKF